MYYSSKAEHFARFLGHTEFKASNGWLENFKKRHNISFKKVCGERGAVDDDVVVDWKASLPDLIKDYDPKNVFNADETALFFKCLPDKTYEFKEEKCHGGKHNKERITLLLASNMTGTDMLKPLVIGKSKKPRCFAGVKSLPVDYTANRKAWMNAELFADWLLKLDKQMGKGKRKIILFIDNCSAHNTIPELKWVKVQFLPANTTSKLQPLDQGIIKNFKVLYRTEVVRRFVADIEDGKECSINLYIHRTQTVDVEKIPKRQRHGSQLQKSRIFINSAYNTRNKQTPLGSDHIQPCTPPADENANKSLSKDSRRKLQTPKLSTYQVTTQGLAQVTTDQLIGKSGGDSQTPSQKQSTYQSMDIAAQNTN
ncbi:tigger transposable element-derived protein 4-like [Homalodisca vitripennis]|uniref:tigger transposable element-derived protein 4-like n=1 Tax=Homalodisca vitripennis TaxID=197043 RepID=UPI001EEAC3DF|nr:tigger transposable element-derived protein 4-like [Homalodisca vitripennis]